MRFLGIPRKPAGLSIESAVHKKRNEFALSIESTGIFVPSVYYSVTCTHSPSF